MGKPTQSVRRFMVENKYSVKGRYLRPTLTPVQMEKRLAWCILHETDKFWDTIFIDEKVKNKSVLSIPICLLLNISLIEKFQWFKVFKMSGKRKMPPGEVPDRERCQNKVRLIIITQKVSQFPLILIRFKKRLSSRMKNRRLKKSYL